MIFMALNYAIFQISALSPSLPIEKSGGLPKQFKLSSHYSISWHILHSYLLTYYSGREEHGILGWIVIQDRLYIPGFPLGFFYHKSNGSFWSYIGPRGAHFFSHVHSLKPLYKMKIGIFFQRVPAKSLFLVHLKTKLEIDFGKHKLWHEIQPSLGR